MNIITRNTLLAYSRKYQDAENALLTWYAVAKEADWKNFNEVRQQYPSTDQVGDDRMVFNIKGNNYCLVARFSFPYKAMQIKWFGPHKAYDKIDVVNIQPEV